MSCLLYISFVKNVTNEFFFKDIWVIDKFHKDVWGTWDCWQIWQKFIGQPVLSLKKKHLLNWKPFYI